MIDIISETQEIREVMRNIKKVSSRHPGAGYQGQHPRQQHAGQAFLETDAPGI